jgi:hypothetical protein
MRLFVMTALLIMAANFVVFIVTPLFQRDGISSQEAVNAAYRNAPDATLRKMADSYKNCAESSLHEARGAAEFRALVARRILSQSTVPESKTSIEAAWREGVGARMGRLDQEARAKMVDYTEDLKRDGVAKCVLSSLI